jgi:CheY-like chemotaxis protein
LQIARQEKIKDSKIPVVLMSAHAAEGEPQYFSASGIDLFLSKPFDSEQLLVGVEEFMEERAEVVE